MKSTSKKNTDAKTASKSKNDQTKVTAPVIDTDENFSDVHKNRQTRPMTDHEPGTV